jgi:Putative Ig domain
MEPTRMFRALSLASKLRSTSPLPTFFLLVASLVSLPVATACGAASANNSSTGTNTAVMLTVPLSIATRALPSATVGSPYADSLAATGGGPPYSWDISSGVLPNGFGLDRDTGLLSGTTTQSGVFAFQVTVTDSHRVATNGSLSVKVVGNTVLPLGIATRALPSATVGSPYADSLAATGGVPPYSWNISSGVLPNGFGLDRDTGLLSGTTSQTGVFAFQVTVTDSHRVATNASLSILVVGNTPPPLGIATQTLPSATVGSPYADSLAATGGVPPYSWDISSGVLPEGFGLDRDTGLLSGTTSQTGLFAFQAAVTDSQEARAYASLSICVLATACNAVTTDAASDVLQAPSLGGCTSNNALVVDAMISGAQMFRVTDCTTQTGANNNFTYATPCGGSADNNIVSLLDNFFLISDTGAHIFMRYLNPAGNDSLALYSNTDPNPPLNFAVNCGEFSYTNDQMFYDGGATATPTVTQYNLGGYNSPSIASPSAPPVQTVIANFLNVTGGTPTWQTLGGMDRNDNVNSLSFHLVQAFSTTGGQGTGCLAAEAITNAVTPVLNNVLYYVYNTCTGVVAEYTWSGSAWSPTTIGTVAMDDRFCIHNIKYHGGLYATITATFGATCTGSGGTSIPGNGSTAEPYYFWNLSTATVIPCVACTGHETEYLNSFIGADDSDGDGVSGNFQQVAYATAGAGMVNTSGTTMTFVGSGIGPNASMTGKIAINNFGYPLGSCNSSTCTIPGGLPTLTDVRYNWPVTGAQGGGFYGAPQLMNYPSLWNFLACTGSSFPYPNQPCYIGPRDNHLNANANPGNDTGLVFYSTTSFGNTNFPRIIATVSVAGSTVTTLYGGAFVASMVGHNAIVNNTNCNIASFISSTQITYSECNLGTLSAAPFYFTAYPGGGYDEVDGVVGGGTAPAPGYNYRFAYTYNTTLNPTFNTQNAITPCGQSKKYCFINTDWQCSLGTTNGTNTTYCAPDWPENTTVTANALLWPRSHNAGGYVYQTSTPCTTGSTEPSLWNQTVDATLTDGSCTWNNIGTYRGDVVVLSLP